LKLRGHNGAVCVSPTPEALIETAMTLAAEAGTRGDPPFGALLVSPHAEVVAMASNRQASAGDPTAHAEMELLRLAARSGQPPPLRGYTVVVNAEPCSMCASALVKSEVGALIYAAPHEPHMDPDLGVADVFAHARNAPRVTAGLLASEAAAQIASLRGGAPAPD
jgi:tRNA(adenine34) deaminase